MQGPFSMSGNTRAVSSRVKLTFHILLIKSNPAFDRPRQLQKETVRTNKKNALNISLPIPLPPSVRSLLSKILEQPLPTLHTRPRTPSHNVSPVPCDPSPSSPSVHPLLDSVSVAHAVVVTIFHLPCSDPVRLLISADLVTNFFFPFSSCLIF